MKAVRCPNGHWYDSETYETCPHCGQTNETPSAKLGETEKTEKKGFSLFKRSEKKSTMIVPEIAKSVSTNEFKANTSTSETHDDVTERFFADIDDDKTVAMFEVDDTVTETVQTPGNLVGNSEISQVETKNTAEPLAAAVQRISAMDEGKTLSYFNAMSAQKDSYVNATSTIKPSEPVVGWLVAISGVHFGESFSLFVGKNTIGRNRNNKVVLGLDQSVSRESHATIIYEPKRREFYLQSGNSDGLVYLNDSFLNGSQILKEKDTLEIGSSKLTFIPLCGTDFSWEQYM